MGLNSPKPFSHAGYCCTTSKLSCIRFPFFFGLDYFVFTFFTYQVKQYGTVTLILHNIKISKFDFMLRAVRYRLAASNFVPCCVNIWQALFGYFISPEDTEALFDISALFQIALKKGTNFKCQYS